MTIIMMVTVEIGQIARGVLEGCLQDQFEWGSWICHASFLPSCLGAWVLGYDTKQKAHHANRIALGK